MCTSTSVVSTPGNRHCTLAVVLPGLHELNLRNIKCAHLKFTVYGYKQANKQASKQASRQARIHMHVCNVVMLMWGSLRLAPIN